MSDVFLLSSPSPELAHERARIISAVRTIAPTAEVLEVGSTAVEGLIGKQDLDLLVRVALEDFPSTRARLDLSFPRDEEQLSNDLYQGYRVPSSLDAALQLTVRGCQYDCFSPFLDALRQDPSLREAYNALKRRWHGESMHGYRAEKSAFIERVLATTPRESAQPVGGTSGSRASCVS